jgi:GNAT superfamily N-acetyltransferase
LSAWRFFAARADGVRVGGAAVVARSEEIELLEGRSDLALLWDIRVAPAARASGVGRALLEAVESWAWEQGIRTMKVETQDVNAPACRFYMRHGYELRAANPQAYRNFADETQLLWYKEIGAATATSGW